MNKAVSLISICICILSHISLKAQNQIAIGQWRSHLNYTRALRSVETNDRIYVATQNGVFWIGKEDGSVNTMSKVEGLHGVRPNGIAYDSESKSVVITYVGGNMDVIRNNRIVNVPFIEESRNVLGDKSINNVDFFNQAAYLATNFGIVVYNILKDEVSESYLNLSSLGNELEISDVQIFNNRIYAATPEGLRSASLDDNMLDFHFWRTDISGSCTELSVFNKQLVVLFVNSEVKRFDGINTLQFIDTLERKINHMDVYHNYLVFSLDNNIEYFDADWNSYLAKTNAPNHGMIDSDGAVWVSTKFYGILKITDKQTFITPNGPGNYTAWDMKWANNELWVASGGVDIAFHPSRINDGIYTYSNNRWQTYSGVNTPEIRAYSDVHVAAIDPENKRKYFGSFNKGLIVFDENNQITTYGTQNSDGAIQAANNDTNPNAAVYIGGIDLDSLGNLWFSQQYAYNQLGVLRKNGKFNSFNIGSEKRVNGVMVDKAGNIWVIIHLDGIYVFNYGEKIDDPSDDKVFKINQADGSGNLPATDVYSLATDRDGEVWIGTSDGISVMYSPNQIFSENGSVSTSRIVINTDDGPSNLLEGQRVNCITIDGANQKWIGTDNGLFVTSPDGTEILYNFNIDNSPILSNYVRKICIDNNTGEVFIANDLGIVSFRGQATTGEEKQTKVVAFPNPVRPGYNGPIAIKGLVTDAVVKITDISGNMVYETIAKGGTAVWYGKNFQGGTVASGVYLVFSSDGLGYDNYVSKIMVIR